MKALFETNISDLNLKHRGKVRDIYDLGNYLLFVATDRISAFDVIMNEPIEDKGKILATISAFWFQLTKHIIPNHFITNNFYEYPEICRPYKDQLIGRSMLVVKCEPLPIEAVVRGYLAGSGWKEYQKSHTVCGHSLPAHLQEFAKLPEPIFTPATKEEQGHDINITFEQMSDIIGHELAQKVKDTSIKLYNFGSDFLVKKGLILADTKFEFGLTKDGTLILIDEVMTPDSSRIWLSDEYAPGKSQYNFDKQILRDYLESIDWNKQYPPPPLPENVIKATLEKYKEAHRRIIGNGKDYEY